jgi:hypothetical protein
MKNTLMKSHIMNLTLTDENALIGLRENELEYDYNFKQFIGTISNEELQYHKSFLNENIYKFIVPFELVPFECRGIKFNMIFCPASEIIKDPFLLGETPVTQELFEVLMGVKYSLGKYSHPKKPMVYVDWYDCVEFCDKLSDYFRNDVRFGRAGIDKRYVHAQRGAAGDYFKIHSESKGFRLPTHIESLFAARAGADDEIFVTADPDNKYKPDYQSVSLKKRSWIMDKGLHPVAQKLPNEWGFYDMICNSIEWCENAMTSDKRKERLVERFIRGCSIRWDDVSGYKMNEKHTNLGFRIAKTI